MKKPIAFIGAFSLSVVIFASVIVTSVIIPKTAEILSFKNSSSANPSASQTESQEISQLLCIYEQDETVFACILKIDYSTAKCGVKNIDLLEPFGKKTFIGIYKTEGLYPFVSAVMGKTRNIEPAFIKFNAESFIKTTDRFQKIVYNTELNGEFLLTGSQAVEIMSPENFGFFCLSLAQEMLKNPAISDILFICNTLENNISIAHIPEKFR